MVEILLATYNGDKFISQLLDSIVTQTYENWVVTIRDDGSTDGTLDIISSYMRYYPGRFNLIEDDEEIKSAKDNFIKLLGESKEEYVMFADQDDVWERDKIERSLNLMINLEKKHGKSVPLLVHSDLKVVDANMHIIAPSFMSLMKLRRNAPLSSLIIQNSVVGCTMIINRALADMGAQLFREPILMHDHALAITAKAYGYVGFLDEDTVYYRQHEANQVGASEGISKFKALLRLKEGKTKFEEDMQASFKQVAVILEKFGNKFTKVKYNDILFGYSKLGKATTGARREFYKSYRVYKKGFIKKLMQILWS